MNNLLRLLFFALIVRPVLLIAVGIHVRGRGSLPAAGPAIIVANHNSHLDTLTILSLFPLRMLPRLRPVAAADYFLRSKAMSWFATTIVGIIALARSGHTPGHHPLEGCIEALDRGDILILFPEGSRGEPEKLSGFKNGIAHLVKLRPNTPVHPLFITGLGKVLPKDAVFLVPFNCDVVIGERMLWPGNTPDFMTMLQARISELTAQVHVAPWE